jgi:hypothetical protein
MPIAPLLTKEDESMIKQYVYELMVRSTGIN